MKTLKIALLGMENAGKSTIVQLLTQGIDINLKSPPDMDPTKGVEQGTLIFNKKSIVVWDFGGQETYRNDYLENPDRYFREISFFFYVVDVQDYYRFIAAALYFAGVFQLIKRFSPDATVVILFHKTLLRFLDYYYSY